jgi:Uma2 family endonuclease
MPSTLTQNKPLYDGLKVTREEYLDLREDGYKYDMIDGVLVMSPSAFFEHNDVLSEIISLLRVFLKQNEAGKAVVETDIYLPDGDDVLRPDITVILKENFGIIKGHIHGVPDIVVEILSESTRMRDLGIKADRYLKNGIKEYWIVDPDKKSIELWQNQKDHWKKSQGDELTSSLLKDLIIKKEDIFS